MTKAIILVGMMGSGKSTIGHLLSERLNCPFYDTDQLIEDHAKLPVSEIFLQKGESVFRQMERDLVQQIITWLPCVISTGGGMIQDEINRKALMNYGIVVFLQAKAETLLQRLKRDTSRPLLQKDDPETVLKSLLNQRTPIYQQAHLTIDVDALAPEIIADQILSQTQRFTRQSRNA
jgi:shikimate kinase